MNFFIFPSIQANTMGDTYKKQMNKYSDYSIPMRPAEKMPQQKTFSYQQMFQQPMRSQAHHSHYPMYPTTSGSYNPSGTIDI